MESSYALLLILFGYQELDSSTTKATLVYIAPSILPTKIQVEWRTNSLTKEFISKQLVSIASSTKVKILHYFEFEGNSINAYERFGDATNSLRSIV